MPTEQDILRFLMDTSGRTPKFYPAEQMQEVGVIPIGQQPSMEQEPQGETDTILQRLAALIEPVANVASLPGSVVRDTLTLRNPLDQLMTPFSAENRTTGRQMLRDYGAVGEEDTYLNAFLGALAEIGTDPLALLGTGVPQAAAKATASGVSAIAPTLSKMVPSAIKNAGTSMAGKASQEVSSVSNYMKPAIQGLADRASSFAGSMKTPGPMPSGTSASMLQQSADRLSSLRSQLSSMPFEEKQKLLTRLMAAGSGATTMTRGEPSGQ